VGRQAPVRLRWKKYVCWNPARPRIHIFTTYNPLTGALKPQSIRPLYNNTVFGTLAVDGWAVTFGAARRGLNGLRLRPCPCSLQRSLKGIYHFGENLYQKLQISAILAAVCPHFLKPQRRNWREGTDLDSLSHVKFVKIAQEDSSLGANLYHKLAFFCDLWAVSPHF